MTTAFFELQTARGLLDKAKRDYAKMENETSTDTIFNFFVTSYHVVDYVKALGTVPQIAIDQLYDDPDFKMCQFLCNKGKHIKLRQGSPFEAKYKAAVTGGILGSFVLGTDVLGGPERFVVLDDGKEVDTVNLGNKLLEKWEASFAAQGIA
jgi:hypothetical protein